MEQKHYAVVDAAILEDDFFTLLQQEDPPCTCLYSEPLDPELAQVAPYLLQVTPPVKTWLDKKHRVPWGYYLYTNETLVNLRLHLKKYLQAKLPNEEKPVFLRFYDPRVIWDLLAVLDDWTLHQFFGLIDKIITIYQGEREETFGAIRSQFPKDSKSHRLMLTLTEAQYDALQQQELAKFRQTLVTVIADQYQQNQSQKNKVFIDKFGVELIPEWTAQESQQRFHQLADELIEFCQRNNIDEDSAKIVATLMSERDIYTMADMPASWKKRLTYQQASSYYNVKVLTTLLKENQEVR